MTTKKSARKYRSNSIQELLNETTPVEIIQTNTKMTLAARLDDLISLRGWGKSEFASKINKNPSEITKWLSGTQNFTIDTLAEIAFVLNMPLVELFEPQKIQVINKVQILIQVKEVEPSILYITPIGNITEVNKNQFRNITKFNTYPLTPSLQS